MKTEIIEVTPSMAREWLKFNTDNRHIRRTVVNGIKAAFLRGEYIQTHQGVAFDVNGVLLDGQHRLTAIAELDDGGYPMLVTTELQPDSSKVIDSGISRTTADLLKRDRKVVEIARLVAFFLKSRHVSFTAQQLEPVADRVQPHHDKLMLTAPASRRVWSSAPVRTAAIVSLMSPYIDPDYVTQLYKKFINCDYDNMPPVANALRKAVDMGAARPTQSGDFYARCMVMFDAVNANRVRIKINDMSYHMRHLHNLFDDLLPPPTTGPAADEPEPMTDTALRVQRAWRNRGDHSHDGY